MGAHRKRFCPRGHDKDVVGRYGGVTGKCKTCADARSLERSRRLKNDPEFLRRKREAGLRYARSAKGIASAASTKAILGRSRRYAKKKLEAE